jgi:thiol-disulfide isomerase/thioredoxin
MTKARQNRALASMLRSASVVLVFSDNCKFCKEYMPKWDKLCDMPNKRANLVSIDASVYDSTPLAKTMPVTTVPTVMFVDENGKAIPVEDHNDMESMSKTIRQGTPYPSSSASDDSLSDMTNVSTMDTDSSSPFSSNVTISENPLLPIPATPIQSSDEVMTGGGSVWSAFLSGLRTKRQRQSKKRRNQKSRKSRKSQKNQKNQKNQKQ